MDYDVVVIGAGPAGATAARILSKNGLSVAVFEKSKLPREKPCGGGVSYKALKMIGPIPNDIVKQKIYGFSFYTKDTSVSVHTNQLLGITVSRHKFDYFLIQKAMHSGADVFESTEIRKVEYIPNLVRIYTKDNKVILGKFVVIADGFPSRFASQLGFYRNTNIRKMGIAVEYEFPIPPTLFDKLDPASLHLFYLNIPHGYGWVFPKQDKISLGIGGQLTRIKYPVQLFHNFKKYIERRYKIILNLEKYYSRILPVVNGQQGVMFKNILFVGDAAGLIDPLTGEGIYYAILSGALAAKTIINNSIQLYPMYINKYIKRELLIAKRLAYLIDIPSLLGILNKAKGINLSKGVSLLSRQHTPYHALLRELVRFWVR